jgi:hypothetical protein
MGRGRSAGSLIGGIILIGLGVVFLLRQFFGMDLLDLTSPLVLLGVGGLFFFGMFLGGPEAARLAIPGSIISMAGFILLLQETFKRWEPSSYAWTFVLLAVGIGLFINGWWGQNERSRQRGAYLVIVSAILCLVFGGFHEFTPVFSRFGVNEEIIGASGLIVLGLFLVMRSSGLFGRLR